MLLASDTSQASPTTDAGAFSGDRSVPAAHLPEAAWFGRLVDGLGYVFWAATWPERRLSFVGQTFEAIWGFPSADALHDPHRLAAAVHPDDRARWAAAVADPDGAELEYRIRRPDGDVRWIRESLFLARDDAGRPVRVVGLAKDVTAYKRVGDALRESEERFRKFFNLNPSPSCIFDARTGRLLEVNTAFEELTGYRRADVQGVSLGRLNIWLDQTLPRLIVGSLRQNGAPRTFDTTIRTRHGRLCDLTVAVSTVGIGGRMCVIAVATEMTEINRLRMQLAENEARFRSLLENAPDILICAALDGEVTYMNHADLGYQNGELVGRNLLDYVADADRLRDVMRRVVAGGEPVSFETQVRFADGRFRWCAGRAAPIRNEDGVAELLLRLRDIEESKAAEARLQKLNAEISEANLKLRELDRLKARFAAMLVHDLRSPLGCVYSALELFEATGKQDDDTRHLVGVARNSLERALDMLNEVQEVYRSEETGVALERAPLDVAALLTEALEIVRPEAERKGIVLKHQPFEAFPLPRLTADRVKLLRAVHNLLANAIKFTPKGGSVVVATAVVNGTGVNIGRDFVEISVTDTGIGIPPEDLPYVFDVYRQSRNHRMGVGVGLGLSIVKSIVAAHGGDVRVESQLGVGTSFTVALPITADGVEPAAT